jgi:hypothetical protein
MALLLGLLESSALYCILSIIRANEKGCDARKIVVQGSGSVILLKGREGIVPPTVCYYDVS